MPISSKTLFHFTNSAEHLVGILKNEFIPHFCLEIHESLGSDGAFPMIDLAIPMVCFCDLPLSNIAEHLKFYGNYGIGMTKQWGLKNGLNPVMYISRASFLNDCISKLFLRAGKILTQDVVREIYDFLGFVKPIEGIILRGNKKIQKSFYDEREWRFVPDFKKKGKTSKNSQFRLNTKEFMNDIKRASANQELEQTVKLSFEPNDIKYLIVANAKEINPTIEAIRVIKNKYDEKTIDLLSSRIIFAKQISDDF